MIAEVEIRDAGRNNWSLSGWATTWTGAAKPYFVADHKGIYLEQVQRNAFANATGGRESVELRREHLADSPVYASTSTGSLMFRDEDRGLLTVGDLSKTHAPTVELVRDIRAGKLNGLSVGMNVLDDAWTEGPDGRTTMRLIRQASLREVSVVKTPANRNSQIIDVRDEARGADGTVIEYRSVPLAFRQWQNQHGRECEDCDGSGRCATCDGEGWVRNGDDLDEIDSNSGRRDRTDAQVEALGKKGLALWVGDHYAWPIVDRVDLQAGIASFGRAKSSAGTGKVKQWIISRARALGAISALPPDWGVRRSAVVIPLDRGPGFGVEVEYAKALSGSWR